MSELKLKNGAKALVIVAHPDDETIWMGGTIARFQNLNWTLFVLCRESDPDRMPKFMRVARYCNALGIIADFEDDGVMNVDESVPQIKKIIRERLPEKKFDYIFAHGANGEYGHPRHIGAHRAVNEMIRDKELVAKTIFYFAYEKKPYILAATPKPNVDFHIRLSSKEWQAKRNVIKKLYGFSQMSFENRSSAKLETFTG